MKPKDAKEFALLAKAEKILNRTLAYQAALAVHALKDELGVDVEALRLEVAPLSMDSPGVYKVTCTIASLVAPEPVSVEIVVAPEKAVTKVAG